MRHISYLFFIQEVGLTKWKLKLRQSKSKIKISSPGHTAVNEHQIDK